MSGTVLILLFPYLLLVQSSKPPSILLIFFSSTNSLFAIPSNQEFVFFKPKSNDKFQFLLELLNDTFEIGNENTADFREFLNQHITLAQTEGNVLQYMTQFILKTLFFKNTRFFG